LKTCDNPHIIKLHALKKTPHNYYLMLEYCNGGDMLAKVRSEGALPEEEVIKDLCQILNAFQILVRHKIMHRDFKLANILLHDGNIKIADFGFAKLLSHEDYATTMLGSPLNMAPEVLGGTKYNNKADIWSIGACIYEMLYGKYASLEIDRPTSPATWSIWLN
jgi:serine/threonine-protein kinase ULK/ATG1